MAEKKYTFTSMFKGNEEGKANGYIEGFTSDIKIGEGNGKPVVSFALATKNTHKDLSYQLGIKLPEGETTFVDVSAWERVSERVQKAKIRKGCLVGVSGFMKVEVYEGTPRLRFTAIDFKVVQYPKTPETEQKESVPAGVNSEPPIQVSDDDLPF